jgi:hypothetical protein
MGWIEGLGRASQGASSPATEKGQHINYRKCLLSYRNLLLPKKQIFLLFSAARLQQKENELWNISYNSLILLEPTDGFEPPTR